MADFPFGARYFTTRERLSELMRGIASLANDSGSQLDQPLPLTRDPADDDQAFLFVACGEVNSGKSAFLNGLLGAREICPVSDLPQPKQPIRHFRYGASRWDEAQGENLELCERPIGALKNFELIDTPGIVNNSESHSTEFIQALSQSDLIFCVLPVSNPWSPATWNFLLQLAPEFHPKVALVIQQIDQREPADIAVMEGHLLDLASKKLDFLPPIFSVSAHEACAGHPASYRLLHGHIDRHLKALESRQQQLRQWISLAGDALDQIEDQVEGLAGQLREQDRFLQEIEEEINEMRESFIQRLPHHLIDVAETFESQGRWVSKQLHRKLGAFLSLVRVFTGDRTASTTEKVFIERIQAAVEEVADRDSAEVVRNCEEHWHQLETRTKESMGIELTSHTPIEESLRASRDHFISRLRQAAELGINNLKVRHLLEKEIRTRNMALKSFTTMCLLFTLAAAICGILEIPWAPWILLGIAGLFATGGTLAAWVTRRNIVRDFKEHLLDTCGAFAQTMEGDFEKALQVVFRDYADALGDVRNHFAREKMSVEPRQRAWQKCFLTLKAIEQDL
ncbi:MAG: GTPase [Akkermansiaceae bacterium]|nr:GTPase [Akkermansiaceae bacterium]